MTTLLDVARKAGVSKSTVSNVVRGASIVADTTRRRVERAIRETGYHPNMIARSLKARTSHAIAIVVPDLTNPFFGELVVSAERAASAMGYGLIAANTECLARLEIEAGRSLIARRVDGVIIAGMSRASRLPQMLLDRDVPVVLASFGGVEDDRLGVVDHDDELAMEVDRRPPLRPRSPPDGIRVAKASRAFRRAAADGFPDGTQAARPYGCDARGWGDSFRRPQRYPRARHHRSAGASGPPVPKDVSVVGYDDIPLAGHHRIGLTTVHSDAGLMGNRAVELLVDAARQARHVASRIVQPNPLIIRTTTAEARS